MYSATNASSLENLIDKIAQFAVAAGWTQHKNTIGSGLRIVALRKGGDYIHIWNTTTSVLNIRGSVGFTSGAAPTAQPNQSARLGTSTFGTGPFANVFMFADNSPAEHIHVVTEIRGGVFAHISFGMLDKTCAGTYTGGTYFDVSFWDATSYRRYTPWSAYHHWLFGSLGQSAALTVGSVRADHGSLTNYFAPFTVAINTTVGTEPIANGLGGGSTDTSTSESLNYGDAARFVSGFYSRSINSWMGVTPMMPIQVRLERAGAYFSLLGEVPNIRFLNMSRFTPGEEVTLGTSDVWKIFPMRRQNEGVNGDTEDSSSQVALAFKKVA